MHSERGGVDFLAAFHEEVDVFGFAEAEEFGKHLG